MSGAGVQRVRGPHGTVVVKAGVGGRELGVYTRLAPVLEDAGIRVPRCLGAHTEQDTTWLVLEDLPMPLPRERWGADADVLETLRSLHALSPDVVTAEIEPFRPRWNDAMTATTATRLGLSTAARQTLSAGLSAAGSLFDSGTVISADPNPLNWAIAADGRVTLMDWDRIGLGHPAIDLAIALPGLPSPGEASRMVAAYDAPVAGSDSPEVSPAEVLLAKAWTVVVRRRGESRPGRSRRSGQRISRRCLGGLVRALARLIGRASAPVIAEKARSQVHRAIHAHRILTFVGIAVGLPTQ